MSENFSVIKKKYFIASIIASAVLGACCGIIVACLLAVVFKTCAVDFHWALYIPIALVSGGGAGALFFLLLRPTDKKVAKKLDKDFALNQKAQTMVEFRHADGEIVALQREQADSALAEVAKKRVDWSFLLKFLVIPVLAAALFFAGIFVPAKKSTKPDDPPFNITDSQKTALINLINDVKASSLNVSVKDPSVEVLNGLLSGLEDEQPQNVMRKAVISSVKIIDGFFATANTYGKIGSAFAEEESLKPFAYALMDSATFYIERGKVIKTFSQVNSKAENADQSVERILTAFANVFLKDFVTETEDTEADPAPISIAQASAKLTAYASNVNRCLASSGCAPKEGETADELYSVLSSFAVSLSNCASATSGMTDNAYYESIKGICLNFASVEGKTVPVLAAQAYNCMMNEYIRNRLAEIFKIDSSQFGESDAVVTVPDGADRPDDGLHGGGWAPGGTEIGSDDLVLDVSVDDGSQIKYGEVISKYEQYFNEMVDSGACSEELQAYITRYFDILYNGIEKEPGA